LTCPSFVYFQGLKPLGQWMGGLEFGPQYRRRTELGQKFCRFAHYCQCREGWVLQTTNVLSHGTFQVIFRFFILLKVILGLIVSWIQES